jgi:hypothetical protein
MTPYRLEPIPWEVHPFRRETALSKVQARAKGPANQRRYQIHWLVCVSEAYSPVGQTSDWKDPPKLVYLSVGEVVLGLPLAARLRPWAADHAFSPRGTISAFLWNSGPACTRFI